MAVRRQRASRTGEVVRGGLGGAAVTVKGKAATPGQRAVIEACLQVGVELGCSRRVLIAIVMCITQESSATAINHGDAAGPDSRGPFQQRDPWGPLAQRMDPAGATRLFLTSNRGHGLNGWRAVHGSLKNAPSPLSHAINRVQISAYPDAYGRWESEATRTVDAFLAGADLDGGQGAAVGAAARSDFSRGQRGGEVESSWDAAGRLAEEVGWRRWAAGNVLGFVSDDELLRQAPGLVMTGAEPWITSRPHGEWGANRPAAEIEFSCLVEDWFLPPNALVEWAGPGGFDGRWLVSSVTGRGITAPDCDVVLRRPVLKQPEAAKERSEKRAQEGTQRFGDLPVTIMRSRLGVKPVGAPYPPPGPHGAFRNAFKDTDAADIRVPVGTPVLAVADGVISGVRDTGNHDPNANPNGINVYLTTPGDRFFYTHMFKVFVSIGQRVSAGDVIATTGAANGVPHLHFEVENGSIKDWV